MSRETLEPKFLGSEVTALPLPEREKSQEVRESLARENYDPRLVVMANSEILSELERFPFRRIGQKLVKGDPLDFKEAFLGMTFVVGATNRGIFRELRSAFQIGHSISYVEQNQLLGPAQTFLTAMAQKETHGILTSEEVAGMVGAAMMDINLRLGFSPYVLETGGMGGDKGFVANGQKKKVINASTLSAIVLSSLKVPVVKHGSYANTSAVGSTEAVEALGVNIYQSSFAEITRLFGETNFYFSDAHVAKTIHDLSHSPFMCHETVNHTVGPMTPPIDKQTRLHKVIGINEGVNPDLVGQAYETLHVRGYQRVGNVLVVAGLSPDCPEEVDAHNMAGCRPYMMLDEVSPAQTLLGVVQNGKYRGCVVVSPEDFGVQIEAEEIQLVNTQEELLLANGRALGGLSQAGSDYLAMNAAVGLFTAEYLGRGDAFDNKGLNRQYLRECFSRCREAIVSGKALQHLEKIKEVSRRRTDD